MLADENVELTLLLRDASKRADAPGNARVVEGDVLDREQLDPAPHLHDCPWHLRRDSRHVRSMEPWLRSNLSVNKIGTDGRFP
jgi:hypothetical protein